MRIAIIADTHLGYARFEEDSFVQAERAFMDASNKADVIIYAGDIFDSRTPKLETLNRAIEILRKVSVPIFAIHGNHERRSRGMINPPKLLATMGLLHYLHGEEFVFEKNGERIQIFGLGNVPEDYAKVAIERMLEKTKMEDGILHILIIHQSLKEISGNDTELSLEDIDELPFDVVIDGHIHEMMVKMGGKLLIPGSTVVTQLKKAESKEKGYILYETISKKTEFVPIETRLFFYEEMEFNGSGISEIRKAVEQRINELKERAVNPIIRIKITGKIMDGLTAQDLKLDGYDNVFIDNQLDGKSLKEKLVRIKEFREEKKPLTEIASKTLSNKVRQQITLFEPEEMFEKLLEGPDAAFEYLQYLQEMKGLRK